MTVSLKVEGAKELEETLKQIASDFSAQQANKFLVGALRASMQPVLARAKGLVPIDTGALRASLQVEARRPSARDKRSQYIASNDVAIALVTTAPGKKLAKTKFTNVKTGKKQVGIESDARAIAVEFGTKKQSAKPFLRPALESQQGVATTILASEINKQIQKYERTIR